MSILDMNVCLAFWVFEEFEEGVYMRRTKMDDVGVVANWAVAGGCANGCCAKPDVDPNGCAAELDVDGGVCCKKVTDRFRCNAFGFKDLPFKIDLGKICGAPPIVLRRWTSFDVRLSITLSNE